MIVLFVTIVKGLSYYINPCYHIYKLLHQWEISMPNKCMKITMYWSASETSPIHSKKNFDKNNIFKMVQNINGTHGEFFFYWLVTLHVFPPKYVLLNTWCKQHQSATIKLSHRCQKPKQVCQLKIQIGTTMLWWYHCEIQKLKEGGISCWRPEGSSARGHQEKRW